MSYAFDTEAIHAGQPNDPLTGAVTFPIYQTSTFGQLKPGVTRNGFSYARSENPTRKALEECLASLEGGTHAVALASGIAAVNTCLNLLKTGDHVIASQDLYGGSYRIFTKVFQKFGIKFSFIDTTDLAEIKNAFTSHTKFLWLESPSNPLLKITDLKKASTLAKNRGVTVIVDNTFATPYLQNPLALGADIVLHSTTKYLNGHSDVIGGALVTQNDSIAEKLPLLPKCGRCSPRPPRLFFNPPRNQNFRRPA